MNSKEHLRQLVNNKLPLIIEEVNVALTGKISEDLLKVLTRLNSGNDLPHWIPELVSSGHLPNLDGKTIGSVIESLFAAVIETTVLQSENIKLNINPARGVDLPDLDLGIKSPSLNFCTSEPFFSAYERLLGSEFDVAVLLTDYRTAKKTPPLKLQLLSGRYLFGSELADQNLCEIAGRVRSSEIAGHDSSFKKVIRFLAYLNKSNWRGKQILDILNMHLENPNKPVTLEPAIKNFNSKNKNYIKKGEEPIPKHELDEILRIADGGDPTRSIVDCCDNWIIDNYESFAQLPSPNEWTRLLSSPLNGKITTSFALQWRYNFKRVFDE